MILQNPQLCALAATWVVIFGNGIFNQFTSAKPNSKAADVTLQTCIREVLSYYSGWVTDCSETFRAILQSLETHSQAVPVQSTIPSKIFPNS
jgi:hypothetical protein